MSYILEKDACTIITGEQAVHHVLADGIAYCWLDAFGDVGDRDYSPAQWVDITLDQFKNDEWAFSELLDGTYEFGIAKDHAIIRPDISL